MLKYSTDGVQNDYNFVGRVQFEEMFDRIQSAPNTTSTTEPTVSVPSAGMEGDGDDGDGEGDREEVDPDDIGGDDDGDIVGTEYDSDLSYELVLFDDDENGGNGNVVNVDGDGRVIYKSVIPGVFTLSSPLMVNNLKRTMSMPSMVLNAPCHFEAEKWSEEGDYYGFIRLKVSGDMVINGRSTISASECGYCNGNGLGVGHFKNDRASKTKFSSGGSYGTASESPHPDCPSGAIYGEDCLTANRLYFGSPCHDASERGGGIIDILCGRKFINFGNVECKGSSGLHFGGSSGGSIRIVADQFVNFGVITAEGGRGALYQRANSKRKQLGTDGGAGRIFILCRRFRNYGVITPEPVVVLSDNVSNFGFCAIKSRNTTF